MAAISHPPVGIRKPFHIPLALCCSSNISMNTLHAFIDRKLMLLLVEYFLYQFPPPRAHVFFAHLYIFKVQPTGSLGGEFDIFMSIIGNLGALSNDLPDSLASADPSSNPPHSRVVVSQCARSI